MRVLFAATELAPWIKVGGLGDFVGSLPRELAPAGVDAAIAIPAHGGVLRRAPHPQHVMHFGIAHRDGPLGVDVYRTTLDRVPVYLIGGGPIAPEGIVYTGRMDDEGRRFTFFSLALVELARRLEPRPDVLHLNDWHTALAAWVLRERRDAEPTLASIGSLLTIHNLPYSGQGAQHESSAFGVRAADDMRIPWDLRGAPLAMGLVAADQLSTVSEGYAREILGPEHGCGFEALLRDRREDLRGILNGLDLVAWDPARDESLAAPYDAADPTARALNRDALLAQLGFDANTDAPVIGLVGRLVGQKGVDLAIGALRSLAAERPLYAVILGTGDPSLEHAVAQLAAERPDRIRARITFDDAMSRHIYAGADALLLPSRYEPCGMAQMIAMRYGCIPVARETGGLADTVRDFDLADHPTGVLFGEGTSESLRFALRRTFALRGKPAAWSQLTHNAMHEDFSWQRSARAYAAVYGSIARGRGAAGTGTT